ncbi:BatA and WFA domain-containing protein [Desulfoscipio sp. XC116]|uniref:vWA domain-containing protein n=1 Tax=Desulfoscipio sp. XC116 TaxID=3144975 RepID=UPI00325A4D4E
MTFYHPWLFWLALTLPAILALYILRPRRRQTVVPSTLLWRPAAFGMEASRPWQRLQSSLLLWLQLLAASLLVLAAAGPVWHGATASGSTIVLLDTSASMGAALGGGTRFDRAREEVLALAAGLRKDDTITVIAFDSQPGVVVRDSDDVEEVRRAVDKVKPGACEGDPGPALSLAGALAGQYDNPRVVLVSDGGLALPDDRADEDDAIPVDEFIPVGDGDASVAIAAINLRSAGSGQAAQVAVVNHGSRPASGLVSLMKGNYPAGSQKWHLDPGKTCYLLWADLPRDVTVQALLKTDSPGMDLLELDNQAWAVPEERMKRKILLVTNGNVFMERALTLLPGSEVYLADTARYEIMLRGDYPYDITVLDGVAGPLPPGAVLLLDPPAGSPVPGLSVGAADNLISLAPVTGSPLLAHVDLADINVREARVLRVGEGWRPDIKSGGQVLFAHAELDGRRLAVWSVNLHRSDLPLRPAFPVLLQNTMDWLLTPGLGVPKLVRPGQEVKIMPSPLSHRLVLEDAGGEAQELAPPFPPASWMPTGLGLYRLISYRAGGSTVREVAVNAYSALEADLRVLDPRDTAGAAGRDEQTGSPSGRALPLARWLALSVLLIIMVEWGVASRGR